MRPPKSSRRIGEKGVDVDYSNLAGDPALFFAELDRHYLLRMGRWEIVELIENGAWDLDGLGPALSFDADDRDLCHFLADLYADEMAGADDWE